MSNEDSDDPCEVVIPMRDELSDGSFDTWPTPDKRFDYRLVDDSRWKAALAEMWVQKTGAFESGESNSSFFIQSVLFSLQEWY